MMDRMIPSARLTVFLISECSFRSITVATYLRCARFNSPDESVISCFFNFSSCLRFTRPLSFLSLPCPHHENGHYDKRYQKHHHSADHFENFWFRHSVTSFHWFLACKKDSPFLDRPSFRFLKRQIIFHFHLWRSVIAVAFWWCTRMVWFILCIIESSWMILWRFRL